MAPTDGNVEWQTSMIIHYLFEDEDAVQTRAFLNDADQYECDGLDDSGDTFDAAAVADKLRTIADSLNDDPRFIVALKDLKQATAQAAVDAAFSHGVETLCEAHVSKGAEVAPEIQLIRASVAFGLFIKKSSPDLKSKVQHAMTGFLNRRVGRWVAQQGGWEKIPDVAK